MRSRTPIVELDGVIAKIECVNPTGSIKDRIAEFIVDESERLGLLRPGMTIVEATSGNTGIALAKYGREKGYNVIIVMPENMTEERKDLIRGFGAELILCGSGDFAEAVRIRDELAARPGFFNPDQFSNELNVECHYRTTGQELIGQVGKRIDAFVAGVGTGGSLIGIGKAIKERWPDVKIVAVEPTESAVMSGGAPGSHSIFGIGDGFIPPIAQNGIGALNDLITEVQQVDSTDALKAAAMLRSRFGLCVGISSGANYTVARRLKGELDTVVTLFPDGYAKYRSYGLTFAGESQCPFSDTCAR